MTHDNAPAAPGETAVAWTDGGFWPLRDPCRRCDAEGLDGIIRATPGAQNGAAVHCAACGRHAFWPSRAELGGAPSPRRKISTPHQGRVFARYGGRCFLCRRLPDPPDNPLQVGHIVSRRDAIEDRGWTAAQADDEANLLTLCAACNLTLGDRSLDPDKVMAERIRRAINLLAGEQ